MDIDLSEFVTGRPKRLCGVGKFAETLTPPERQKLEAALETETILATDIHRWLVDKGAEVKYNAVGLHRRKACSCH